MMQYKFILAILPYTLAFVIIAIIVLLIYMVRLIRQMMKKKEPERAPKKDAKEAKPGKAEVAEEKSQPQAPTPNYADSIRNSFQDVEGILKQNVTSGRQKSYQIPCFMMMGNDAVGKSTLLQNLNIPQEYRRPSGISLLAPYSLNWWFFNRGIVIDLAGEYLNPDAPAKDKNWSQVLKQLVRYRPQRPLDGVILTISAELLLATRSMNDADKEKLFQASEKVYQRLWDIQKQSGMFFPVYIVVTKADQIPGFGSLVKNLPENMRDSIFGWSNPYTAEVTYTPEWIDDAYRSMLKNLQQIQMEIFAHQPKIIGEDELFTFPFDFRSLKPALTHYLNTVFRQSIYHESFFLRGIYFVGSEDSHEPHCPIFSKDLFEQRIFKEFALAEPTRTRIAVVKKNVMFLKTAMVALLLLWIVGFSISGCRFHSKAQRFMPAIGQLIKSINLYRFALPVLRETRDNQPFQTLIHNIDQVVSFKPDNFHSVFVPTSWIYSPEYRLYNTITLAYNDILYKSFFYQLHYLTLSTIRKNYAFNMDTLSAPIKYHEEISIYNYVNNIRKLEQAILIFNSAELRDKITNFDTLMQSIFLIKLPVQILEDDIYYPYAMSKLTVQTFPLNDYRDEATKKLYLLFSLLKYRMSDANILVRTIDRLNGVIENVISQPRIGMFKELRELIDHIQNSPENIWLFRTRRSGGSEFQDMLANIRESQFFGEEMSQTISRLGDDLFRKLQYTFENIELKMIGRVFVKNENDEYYSLSSKLIDFKQALDHFMMMDFIDPVLNGSLPAIIGDGMKVQWNLARLQETRQIMSKYQFFADSQLTMFPQAVQGVALRIAKDQLSNRLFNTLLQSYDLVPQKRKFGATRMESDLEDEIDNLQRSVESLLSLLSFFNQNEYLVNYDQLAYFLARQLGDLLQEIDMMLEQETLYAYNHEGLQKWDGRASLTKALYGYSTPTEKKDFVTWQRERLSVLAQKYAMPLLSLIENSGVKNRLSYSALLDKWQNILWELEKYSTKKPDAGLAILEDFIVNGLDRINLMNFREEIPPDILHREGDNYFIQKRNEILIQVYARCVLLSEREQTEQYTQLAVYFNENLAGRFPFASFYDQKQPNEADPAYIHEFFTLYDRFGPSCIESFKKMGNKQKQTQDALHFLEAMEKNREFFTSEVENPLGQRGLTLSLEVEFRVNQEKETNANQIIDWSMKSGSQSINFLSEDKRVVWNLGDPITVSFRWAKNSPLVPAQDETDYTESVQGEMISFVFHNTWSVFQLLHKQIAQGSDLSGFFDRDPHTLKFIMYSVKKETQVLGDEITAEELFQTVVFIRLRLYSAVSKKRIILSELPKIAPYLNGKP